MKTADKAKLKNDLENAKGRTVRVDMLLPVKWKKQLTATIQPKGGAK